MTLNNEQCKIRSNLINFNSFELNYHSYNFGGVLSLKLDQLLYFPYSYFLLKCKHHYNHKNKILNFSIIYIVSFPTLLFAFELSLIILRFLSRIYNRLQHLINSIFYHVPLFILFDYSVSFLLLFRKEKDCYIIIFF